MNIFFIEDSYNSIIAFFYPLDNTQVIHRILNIKKAYFKKNIDFSTVFPPAY